jgi:hypothetical protein
MKQRPSMRRSAARSRQLGLAVVVMIVSFEK